MTSLDRLLSSSFHPVVPIETSFHRLRPLSSHTPVSSSHLSLRDEPLPHRFVSCERDDNMGIIHIEVRHRGWRGIFGRLPPFLSFLRPKPLAKCGLRAYSASSVGNLAENIRNIYGEDEEGGVTATKVGFFMYMWITPKLRGGIIGDWLLRAASDVIVKRGDNFMMLVHDDDGSGRLVEYYRQRGFYMLQGVVDNGMLCKIQP